MSQTPLVTTESEPESHRPALISPGKMLLDCDTGPEHPMMAAHLSAVGGRGPGVMSVAFVQKMLLDCETGPAVGYYQSNVVTRCDGGEQSDFFLYQLLDSNDT